MKLESPEIPIKVQSDGELVQHTLRLDDKTKRKIFGLLSKPYVNTVAAVIRELSTNASDEHIKFKVDKPFEVHLPTAARLWFTIRDFAEGLSPEGMKEYCSYAYSDKTHSNDYNGCLGIGSKSPFAYTDVYTIISRHNGIKYLYNLFIGEDGIPAHVLMGQEPTSEESGLEIQIPVKSEDVRKFNNYASKIYQWFDVKPTFLGTQIEIEDIDYTLKEDKFGISEHDLNHGISIVMGQVEYKYVINEMDFEENFTDFNEIGIYIFADIGQLDFEPGRERISQTSKNIKYIHESLIYIRNKLVELAQKEISECKCYFDAMIKYSDMSNTRLYKYVLSKLIDSKILYNGKTIDNRIRKEIETDVKFYDSSNNKPDTWCYPCTQMLLFVDDTKSGGYQQFVRIEKFHTFETSRYLQLVKGDNAEIQKLIDFYEIPEENVAYISKYPKYLERVSRTQVISSDIMLFNKSGFSPKTYWKTVSDFDFSEGGYYVPFNNYGYNKINEKGDSDRWDAVTLLEYINVVQYKQCKDIVLVGAKKSKLEEFKSSSKWTNITDHVDVMELHQSMASHLSVLFLANKLSILPTRYTEPFYSCSDFVTVLDNLQQAVDSKDIDINDIEDEEFRKFLLRYIMISTDNDLISYYNSLLTCLKFYDIEDINKLLEVNSIAETCDMFSKKYTMFKYTAEAYGVWGRIKSKDVLSYINQINKSEKEN